MTTKGKVLFGLVLVAGVGGTVWYLRRRPKVTAVISELGIRGCDCVRYTHKSDGTMSYEVVPRQLCIDDGMGSDFDECPDANAGTELLNSIKSGWSSLMGSFGGGA